MLKKLKEMVVISPLIIAFATLLGYMKLNIYFGLFHVKISDFIDISEILTYFMNDLWSILSVFMGVVIYFLFVIILVIVFSKIFKFPNPYNDSSPLFRYKKFTWQFFLVSIVVTILPSAIYFYNPNKLLLIPATLYFIQLLLMLTHKIKEETSTVLMVIVVSISLAISLGWYDYKETITNESKYSYFKIGSKKTELAHKRVIGVTKRFIFIQNDSTLNVTILKMDEINELEIKR